MMIIRYTCNSEQGRPIDLGNNALVSVGSCLHIHNESPCDPKRQRYATVARGIECTFPS